jgi:hypothetical protein
VGVEIACDESGSEGENLVGGNTDVFAHAGVRLPAADAEAGVRETRRRIRSPALEYKANHLLREKHRAVLVWLLGVSGPIHGHARVHLVDKEFHLLGRVVDLLGGDPATARELRGDGPLVLGPARWRELLAAANALLRTRSRPEAPAPVDAFFRALDAAVRAAPPGPVRDHLAALATARPRALAHRDHPPADSVLDPLLPAIARAVEWWGGGRPVSLVHDQHNALTADRVARLADTLPLAAFRLVDSRTDPRVQLADFLAGVARRIASDELNGRGDAELTALLRPYVDPRSVWGDAASWALLRPDGATGGRPGPGR